MNKIVFKESMMQTVCDFCMKTLKDIVKEHEKEIYNYQISFDMDSSLISAKEYVETAVDTLDDDDLKNRKKIKEVVGNAVKTTKNVPFSANATLIKRGTKIFVKNSDIVVFGNSDLIRTNMLLNLYRFEEWLKHDITTLLKHEFGHVLHYIELDGTSYSEWYENFKKNNEALDDFHKWVEESKENNTYTVEEGVIRYHSIPDEAKANALGNVTIDELIRIETVNDYKGYTIEVKSYKK